MKALTEADIRRSFVNCSKGEASRLTVPRDLAERPWEQLDFLGWRDPAAPGRCYVVAEHEGRLTGIGLRHPGAARSRQHQSMCSVCLTTHPGGGVSLMTARRAGAAGREGNSTGVYMCTDLSCSLYVRGVRRPEPSARFEESLTVAEKVERTRTNLFRFLDAVTRA